MMKMHLLAGVSGLVILGSSGFAFAEPATFDTPEAAVAAVIAAIEAKDRDALLAVFGPENSDVVFSGDDEQDRETWGGFISEYRELNRIEADTEGVAILHIGTDDWPFPAPIVQKDAKWSFDGAAAREEVALRRLGLNELDVIDVLSAGVEVQQDYRLTDHDGDGVMEFAASILSSPGARDGLYWPSEPGTPESPIGPNMARANAEGYNFDGTDSEPDPYLGYYFRILQKQGEAAPGGAYDYMIGGNMVAGYAFLAYPAVYGETGVTSFIVGENGIVYESDLGDNTLELGNAIMTFNPGEGWKPYE
jgi:hypothetical protein